VRWHNVCFVVPGEHRAQRLVQEGREDAWQVPSARFWVTTTDDLDACGPLGEVWRCLDHEDRRYGMADFETLDGAEVTPRERTLGRRWQVPMPERWAALSPLGARGRPQDTPAAVAAEQDELAREWEQRRAQERTAAEHERQHAPAGRPWDEEGLRSAASSDLLDHPQDHEQEEPWR
jgi:hypothetical protein